MNCVTPGLNQTPGASETLSINASYMPSGKEVDRNIGPTENVADVVQFLARPAAAFVTGETYTVKGVPRTSNAVNTHIGLE